jgi:hypothetical protein
MGIADKLEVLRAVTADPAQFDLVLDKMLEGLLSQYRLQVARYEQDLQNFEQRYGMISPAFYEQFESGKLGDPMDFFEWAGIYELQQNLLKKSNGWSKHCEGCG